MIKNNFLGQILVGALVVFLLVSSIQMFGWGQGIDAVELDKENPPELPNVPNVKKEKSDTLKEDSKNLLTTINTRPMFSDSREPFKEDETDLSTGTEEEPVSELKAQLTGVVITPEHSYAMILDTITNERETYKVGMPLVGEQGGWTLNVIQGRKVVFVSDDDKSEELVLEVHSGGLKAGTKTKKDNKNNKDSKNKVASNEVSQNPNKKTKDTDKNDKKKNADDIRKKIAERRAQMRADAAKKQ